MDLNLDSKKNLIQIQLINLGWLINHFYHPRIWHQSSPNNLDEVTHVHIKSGWL